MFSIFSSYRFLYTKTPKIWKIKYNKIQYIYIYYKVSFLIITTNYFYNLVVFEYYYKLIYVIKSNIIINYWYIWGFDKFFSNSLL